MTSHNAPGQTDPAANHPPCAGCPGCGGPDCIARPDTSGSARTVSGSDPDGSGQQGADQGGHNPDALRTRLAAALHEDPHADWHYLTGRAAEIREGRDRADAECNRLRRMVDEYSAGARGLSDKLRAERAEAEAARWLAFIERGLDTHMSFGVINPDGTTQQLPCADWCHACRVERAEAGLVLARQAHLRLTAYLTGFADVLDTSDRGPWANTVGAALADLERALAEPTDGSSR